MKQWTYITHDGVTTEYNRDIGVLTDFKNTSLDELKNTAKILQSGIMTAIVALSKPLLGGRGVPAPVDTTDYTGYYIAGGVVLVGGGVLLLSR